MNNKTCTAFVRVSIAVKRYHDHGNSYKGKTIWAAYIFRGLVHYHRGATSSMQEVTVLETLYILTHRQHEERWDWVWLSI